MCQICVKSIYKYFLFFTDGTPRTPKRTPGTPRGRRTPGDNIPGTSPARALASSPIGNFYLFLIAALLSGLIPYKCDYYKYELICV